ncbi:uncharacterized protein N7529_000115 [Penicillium soppii]|uniref:uncharacterized protein n=1 Tax=Penicillium soppii TaxID=69789 RepID=UPI002548E5F3|nr:uncharacterized protein N7529_000115 [Penicillium soppii]KAJ5881443.1 hypothetical protein N7529_000115 [Penicillium soppii]
MEWPSAFNVAKFDGFSVEITIHCKYLPKRYRPSVTASNSQQPDSAAVENQEQETTAANTTPDDEA